MVLLVVHHGAAGGAPWCGWWCTMVKRANAPHIRLWGGGVVVHSLPALWCTREGGGCAEELVVLLLPVVPHY